ncbi:hypothetical protein OS493_011571 [Desmophyllum pertusum]|uniref:Transmembrane protein 272-like n=1 Tax=Desmophyllum pertusum TaxID=174260 RepID=A0A9W9YTJ0_9CNID|nr:hypothetical protein OS493_011571 [Desmophyllum pertusum]
MVDTEKKSMEGEPVEPYGTAAPPTYGTDSGALPTYDEATGPPPSYQSLFGEIQGARENSSGTMDFMRKLVLLLAGTIGCTVLIGLFMALPIAMIVIGAQYKNQCPVEDKIPIYLIVAGAVGVFRNLIALCQRAKEGINQEEEEEKKKTHLESILDCFLFIWFICGNVWIYQNYQPIYDDPSSSDYCHKTLYLFAFWVTTCTYIFVGPCAVVFVVWVFVLQLLATIHKNLRRFPLDVRAKSAKIKLPKKY